MRRFVFSDHAYKIYIFGIPSANMCSNYGNRRPRNYCEEK